MNEARVDQISRLLMEDSLEAKVRRMKKKGLSADDVAKTLLDAGGCDADHIGSVIVKVYRLKRAEGTHQQSSR